MNTSLNHSYIIADHIRASCFIISDGVTPSGKQRGYILRRLIRRSLSASLKLNIDIKNIDYFEELVSSVVTIYSGVFDSLKENQEKIVQVIFEEAKKYNNAIDTGTKQWSKFLNQA